MFVVIADVTLKSDSIDDFKKWFAESNKIVSKFDGFISRRLLQSHDGKHRIIVEFDNKESFNAMHQSEEHSQLHSKAITFMDATPSPKFYNVVAQ